MARGVCCLLLLAGIASAQGEYERILREAAREKRKIRQGDSADMPLDRAYQMMADAVRVAPDRWEAFMHRGVNRVEKAVMNRTQLEDHVTFMRARGAPLAQVRGFQAGGEQFVARSVQQAFRDFSIMARNMQKTGEWDPVRKLLADALMKYAGREYLKAKRGASGAIKDFTELVRRNFMPEFCRGMVARCYLDLGAQAVEKDDFALAQEHWDKALKFVLDPAWRQQILTNKAAAYNQDNEFGRSEEILRQQAKEQPGNPKHWKNIGLILGLQGRLRAALDAYRRAREICYAAGTPALARLHGNAWLRAAMIHGKLLEEDGDLLKAWRLFLEYRGLFGDDYNFSFAFGDFCFHMRQYDLAYRYLTHARDLYPFCPGPYQRILNAAQRMSGTKEEIEKRVEEAKKKEADARAQYDPGAQTGALNRLCSGLWDLSEGGPDPGEAAFLEPDPLAGGTPEKPPEWIARTAAQREPFRPYDPAIDRPEPARPAETDEASESEAEGESVGVVTYVGVGAVVVICAGVLWILRRKRPASAA